MSTSLGWMILETAGLSFLGLGAQPPRADLGGMLGEGRHLMATAPHLSLVPGAAIFVVVVAAAFTFAQNRTEVLQPPDVDRISSDLLAEGIPRDWNTSNVVLPGILTDDELDARKWDNLSALSGDELRALLLLSGDVYFRVVQHNGTGYESVLADVTTSNITYDQIGELNEGSIAATWRIAAFNGSLVAIEVIGWP